MREQLSHVLALLKKTENRFFLSASTGLSSISAAHSSSDILTAKRRLDARAIDCVCDVNSVYNLWEVSGCGEMALDNTKG